MPRRPLPVLCLLAALALTACAGAGHNRYGEERDRLEAECRARGGTFMPIPRAHTGNPGADHVCDLHGGRLTRR